MQGQPKGKMILPYVGLPNRVDPLLSLSTSTMFSFESSFFSFYPRSKRGLKSVLSDLAIPAGGHRNKPLN